MQLQSFNLDLTIIKHSSYVLEEIEKGIIQEIETSELKQKLWHGNYSSDTHEGITNWCVTLSDQVEDKKQLRKKELNKLNA